MKKQIAKGVLPLVVFVMVWGCSEEVGQKVTGPGEEQPPQDVEVATCLDCHSSEQALKTALGPNATVGPLATAGDG